MRGIATAILSMCGAGILWGYSVKGSVTDNNLTPLSGITARIVCDADSSNISATLTDENGLFVLELADNDFGTDIMNRPGKNYSLVLEGIGYHTKEIKLSMDGESIKITLDKSEHQLPEVEVLQSRINFNAKGFTANLAGNPLAEGKNAPELLGYLPGISYDKIHGLEVLCKRPEVVYIDGIKTASSDELNNIPATDISSVEIRYMGGVSESSTSTGAIVYITMKQLWDGSYSGYLYGRGMGYYGMGFHSTNFSPNFRLKKGKISLSNTAGYGYQRLKSKETNKYTYDIPENGQLKDMSPVYEVSYTDLNRGDCNQAWDRFTLNYQLADNGMLSSSLYYTHISKDITKQIIPHSPENSTQTLATPDHNNNVQVAVQLKQPLKNGAQVNAALDYIMDEALLKQDMTSLSSGTNNYTTSERSFTHLLKGKANINLPLGSGKLYTGADFQYTRIKDKYDLRHLSTTQSTSMNSYSPSIFAEYSGNIRNFDYSIGARAQGYITDVNYNSETNRHEQWGICPSADIMYAFNRERGHMLSIGYYYTLHQLPYTLIMAQPRFSGPHSYTIGNPDLKAPRSHGATLMARIFNSYSISARFYYSTDNIDFQPTIIGSSPAMFLYTPYNCPNQWGISISADGNINPLKWWTLRPSIRMSKDRTHTPWGIFNSNVEWRLSLTSNMQLPHDMGLALSYQYEGESRFSEVTLKPVSYLYGSFYKYLLKRTIQLTLDVTLYQTRRTAITRTPEAIRTYYHKTHNENIEIGVAWFFKGGKRERINTEDAIFQRLQQITNTKI